MRIVGQYLRYALETLGALLVWGVLRLLPPLTARRGMGKLLGWLGPKTPPHQRIISNLRFALPEQREAHESIARAAWDNFGQVIGMLPHWRWFCARTIIIDNAGLASLQQRRCLFFSAHYANWEMTWLAVRPLFPLSGGFYRMANNPLVDRLIQWLRDDKNMLPKGRKGAKAAVQLLGQQGHIMMLMDQKMNDGVAATFFGKPAMTATAIAQLALRYGATIVPIRCETHDGFDTVTIEPPLQLTFSGNKEHDIALILTTINQTLEQWIRHNPGAWFWLHRRWGKTI